MGRLGEMSVPCEQLKLVMICAFEGVFVGVRIVTFTIYRRRLEYISDQSKMRRKSHQATFSYNVDQSLGSVIADTGR